MKSLFDTDVPDVVFQRTYTVNYQIRHIFEKLISQLRPEIIAVKKTKRYNAMGIRGQDVILKSYICHCDFSNKHVEHPFPDTSVIVTRRRIQIQNPNFQYTFPPMMLLQTWERIKPLITKE